MTTCFTKKNAHMKYTMFVDKNKIPSLSGTDQEHSITGIQSTSSQ